MGLVKYNNNSISAVTATGLANGAMTHIKTLTASASATLSFVDGADSVVLDSTYPIYVFKVINAHPSAENVKLNINFRDGDTAYDAVKTTTAFSASHYENNSAYAFQYEVSKDLAQSTGVQTLHINTFKGSVEDTSVCSEIFLYNPSSTTFVKHFIIRSINMGNDGANSFSEDSYIAGYCNTTAAIDGVQFTMDSGNIDAGQIKLYGIKDS